MNVCDVVFDPVVTTLSPLVYPIVYHFVPRRRPRRLPRCRQRRRPRRNPVRPLHLKEHTMRPINRTGEVNGKLTVIHQASSKGGHSYWNCSCECGKVVTVASSNLKKTLSCGCLKEDYISPKTYGRIYMRLKGCLRPGLLIRKRQVALADRAKWPRGYWVCVCLGCNSFTRASTRQLDTMDVISCPKPTCRKRAEHELANRTKQDYLWREEAVRGTLTRNTFNPVRRRCNDHTDARYGGRGIHICDRWNLPNGEGYRNFVADKGLRPHRGLTLERIDNNGDYTPENCYWADIRTQSRNKSTSRKFRVRGEEMNQCDLAVALGTSDKALSQRIERFRKAGFTQGQIEEKLSVDLHSVQTTSTQHQPRGLAA
jgi:hypothetical protein